MKAARTTSEIAIKNEETGIDYYTVGTSEHRPADPTNLLIPIFLYCNCSLRLSLATYFPPKPSHC